VVLTAVAAPHAGFVVAAAAAAQSRTSIFLWRFASERGPTSDGSGTSTSGDGTRAAGLTGVATAASQSSSAFFPRRSHAGATHRSPPASPPLPLPLPPPSLLLPLCGVKKHWHMACIMVRGRAGGAGVLAGGGALLDPLEGPAAVNAPGLAKAPLVDCSSSSILCAEAICEAMSIECRGEFFHDGILRNDWAGDRGSTLTASTAPDLRTAIIGVRDFTFGSLFCRAGEKGRATRVRGGGRGRGRRRRAQGGGAGSANVWSADARGRSAPARRRTHQRGRARGGGVALGRLGECWGGVARVLDGGDHRRHRGEVDACDGDVGRLKLSRVLMNPGRPTAVWNME